MDSRTTCVTLDRLDIHQPQKQRGDKLDENKNPFVWPKPNQVWLSLSYGKWVEMIRLSIHATFLVPFKLQISSRLRAPSRIATTLSNFVPRSRARLPLLLSPPTRKTRRARRSSSTPWRPLPPPRRRERTTTAALGRPWCPYRPSRVIHRGMKRGRRIFSEMGSP